MLLLIVGLLDVNHLTIDFQDALVELIKLESVVEEVRRGGRQYHLSQDRW